MWNIAALVLLVAGFSSCSNTCRDEDGAAQDPSPPLSPLWRSEDTPVLSNALDSSVVWCDHTVYCPDRTTCCRHPTGLWFCCPQYPGRCCLDGYHCCPWGYDCDVTYTHCVRKGLMYPFALKRPAPAMIPANQM